MRLELAPEFKIAGQVEPAKIKILYFTDPDCSWCWALEPIVKKLLEEYSGQLKIVYRMGGLLEAWDDFFDARNQIGRPDQVAAHWVEVAERSGMPIDEQIWLEDPPDSTYPGCIAYRAAFIQDEKLAEAYLRRLREAVLTERRNIACENVLFDLAAPLEFDMDWFREDFLTGRAQEAFRADLSEVRGRGISGFPTIVLINREEQEITLSGYREYEAYEGALHALAPNELHKMPLLPISHFVGKYGHVATEEIATVYGLDRPDAILQLDRLASSGEIVRESRAGGEFWLPG